jgi:hypothetical protein
MKEVDVMIKFRTIIFIGLMFFLVAVTSAQTVLPNWVIDSLIYEASYSRKCEQVRIAQADEINKLGAELMHTNTALDLKQSETSTLESLLSNSKEQGRVDKMQHDLNEKVLKDKVKKRTFLIIGETILIVILLL